MDSTPTQGLSDAEAAERLRRDGPNVLPSLSHRGLVEIIWRALTQPMFVLLLGAAVLYAVLGNLRDAGMLLLSVLAVAGLSVYQEQRTERVLEALKALSSPRSTVVRGGRTVRVASRELVRGDRLLLHEGDRLAADGCLLEAAGLQVDESQRTGESVPLSKVPGDPLQGGQLFAGSLVVRGEGVALVTQTGMATAIGAVHRSMARLPPRSSRLQEELQRLVRRVALLAAITCAAAAAAYAIRDGSWAQGLLVGLTLAMALIPEEFAVVWNVMLALGSWRLTRAQVLTRQPQAIEALGTASVLCVDKTGTLTRNRMALVALGDGHDEWTALDSRSPLPALQGLLSAALLASRQDGIEPMDEAIRRLAQEATICREPDWQPVAHRGIRPGEPYVVHWWRTPGESRPTVAVKGAPEAVLALCDATSARTEELRALASRWSARGLRVLAVARGDGSGPGNDGGLAADARLTAVGLLGFEDPLRAEVPAAIAECRRAGVRIVMITGDSALTALAIARQAGLVVDGDAKAVTGKEVAGMDAAALQRCVGDVDVFARVDPDQKLRIVRALQARGEVVAMTGDGVNDAPALKAADIGVAMGQRGTDVAREASSLVLLDDNFASLVEAVRAGRRIFTNLRRALGYLFAVHVPIAGAALVPVLFGGPALLLPLHVVLLELLIDPACSLVFESEPAAKDSMQVPPRARQEALFSLDAVGRAVGLGALVLLGTGLVQWLGHLGGASAPALRTASLGSIVIGNIVLLVWFRRKGGHEATANAAFDALVLAVCLVWSVLTSLPSVAELFDLATIAWPWSAWIALPAGWSAWRLLRRCDRAPTGPAADSRPHRF